MRLWARLTCLILFGCAETGSPALPVVESSVRPSPMSQPVSRVEPEDCAARIRGIEAQGLERFQLDPRRGELLARAKGSPVLFVRAPRWDPSTDHPAGALVQRFRQRIVAENAGRDARDLVRELRRNRSLLPQVLLREGYFYIEEPRLAELLVLSTKLHDLFDAPALVIERGNQRLRATKSEDGYIYDNGPDAGLSATLLLFDRVFAEGEEPGPPLHRDPRPLAAELGFDRMDVRGASSQALLADLSYGDVRVPSLFSASGESLELECEAVPEREKARVAESRALARRRSQAVSSLRRVIDEQVRERLPFDEPKTEDGQQDGKLRPEWKWAYRHGQDVFRFNDDRYFVFNAEGRPKVPQVCIDFIMDTLERASGTWWRSDRETRERTFGALDFDRYSLQNRRSVEQFLKFTRSHAEWFDVYQLSREERVRFSRGARFFEALAAQRRRYQPGDVVIILGPRDDDLLHYHSFFVVEADPLTEMPTLVAANAGEPRVRTWAAEMRSAPRRSVHSRIRIRLDFLETILPSLDHTGSDHSGRRPVECAGPSNAARETSGAWSTSTG